MKIVRIEENSTGNIAYGALQADGSVLALSGDIFANPEVTSRKIEGKLLAPIEPHTILAIGLNYRKHAEETGSPLPQFPMLFLKSVSCLQNPGDSVVLPRKLRSDKVDYEAELAIVIGKRCKNVAKDEALDYVLGYTCANDVSARDWQKEWGGGQFCRAKSFDTFCPLGPAIVTTDDISDPNQLQIKAVLNGKTVQDSNTRDMIFDVPTLISFLSGSTTLMPGTIILTGTPEGVGMGRKPPLWLQAGDEISIEIEKIGVLTNRVEEEA